MYFLLIFLPAVSYAGYYTPLSSIDIKNETNTSMKITVDVHGTRFNCITLENNSIKDDATLPSHGHLYADVKLSNSDNCEQSSFVVIDIFDSARKTKFGGYRFVNRSPLNPGADCYSHHPYIMSGDYTLNTKTRTATAKLKITEDSKSPAVTLCKR